MGIRSTRVQFVGGSFQVSVDKSLLSCPIRGQPHHKHEQEGLCAQEDFPLTILPWESLRLDYSKACCGFPLFVIAFVKGRGSF